MNRTLLLAAVFTLLLAPGFAQAPAMSNDSQKLPVAMDDCARIGRRTLEREGYQIGATGNNWVSGTRDIHRALIICDAAPDGTWTNVVVSSNTQEYEFSGREQRLLMNRLAELAANQRFDDRDRDRDRYRDADRDHDRGFRPAWLNMSAQQPLPGNAVPGGKEPNHPVPQYVCRAQYEGNLVPGKTVSGGSSTDCLISFQGAEVRTVAFDVLTGGPDDYAWMAPNAGRPPLYTGNEAGGQLRSCRFELYVRNENKGLQLGKEMTGKCFVGYKGMAYSSDRYEVLYPNR